MLRFAFESGNKGVWLLCNINTKNCESNIAIEETSVSCRILMSFLYNLNNLPDPREAYRNDSCHWVSMIYSTSHFGVAINIYIYLTLSEHFSLTLSD